MKQLFFLFTATCLLLPVFILAQDNVPVKNLNPFAAGNNQFPLKQNASLKFLNVYEDGEKTGKTNSESVFIIYNRFITNGFAIGGQLSANWSGDHNGVDYLNRAWTGGVYLTYGKHFSDKFNMYVRLGGKYGQEKDITEYSGNTTTDEWKKYEFNSRVAFPFVMNKAQTVYGTPSINYKYSGWDYDDSKETGSEIEFYYGFEDYSDCDEMGWDEDREFSKDMYDQGSAFIDYYSKLAVSFSGNKTVYDNTSINDYRNTLSRIRFHANGGFYLADNFAAGLNVRVDAGSEKEKDTDFKYNWSEWTVGPFINYNLPSKGCWNNMFLEAGAEFGGNTNKNSYVTGSTTNKYSVFDWRVGLAYNLFIGPNISLTPKLSWEQNSEKNKDDDSKYEEKGVVFRLGTRYSF